MTQKVTQRFPKHWGWGSALLLLWHIFFQGLLHLNPSLPTSAMGGGRAGACNGAPCVINWWSWRSIGIKILRQMVLKAPNRGSSEQSEYVLIILIKTTYVPIVGQVTPYLDNWYQGSLQDRPTERAQKCHGPTGGELLEFRGEFPDEMCMPYHALSIWLYAAGRRCDKIGKIKKNIHMKVCRLQVSSTRQVRQGEEHVSSNLSWALSISANIYFWIGRKRLFDFDVWIQRLTHSLQAGAFATTIAQVHDGNYALFWESVYVCSTLFNLEPQ